MTIDAKCLGHGVVPYWQERLNKITKALRQYAVS
jgi:hypothetical protein